MATDFEQGSICQWHDGFECQFVGLRANTIVLGGRAYCVLHRPLAAHTPESIANAIAQIRVYATQENQKFDGVTFPSGSYEFQNNASYSFQYCTFAGDCELVLSQLRPKDLVLNRSRSFGRLRIRCSEVGSLIATDCTFTGSLQVTASSRNRVIRSAAFDRSKFGQDFVFSYEHTPIRLSFVDCTFEKAPDFTAVKEFPQRTFIRANFTSSAITAEDEGRYRKIRNLFNSNRAREEEGLFYALEKRCHRQTLDPRKVRNWVPRAFSWLYDITSSYGQSYERALTWFVLVQIVASLAYSIGANRFSVPGHLDTEIIGFTLAQVVRPFEILAPRDLAGWAYDFQAIKPAPSVGWLFATLLHSVASLALFALFVLAVRWRFRRE